MVNGHIDLTLEENKIQKSIREKENPVTREDYIGLLWGYKEKNADIIGMSGRLFKEITSRQKEDTINKDMFLYRGIYTDSTLLADREMIYLRNTEDFRTWLRMVSIARHRVEPRYAKIISRENFIGGNYKTEVYDSEEMVSYSVDLIIILTEGELSDKQMDKIESRVTELASIPYVFIVNIKERIAADVRSIAHMEESTEEKKKPVVVNTIIDEEYLF